MGVLQFLRVLMGWLTSHYLNLQGGCPPGRYQMDSASAFGDEIHAPEPTSRLPTRRLLGPIRAKKNWRWGLGDHIGKIDHALARLYRSRVFLWISPHPDELH